MKTIFLRAVVGLCWLVLLGIWSNSLAGWTEDTRLTYRGYEIEPQVIARNDTVHVAWQQIAGDHLVSYMRSIDGGLMWGELVDLVEEGHRGSRIDLSLTGGDIGAGWCDYIPFDEVYIAFTVSVGGENWTQSEYVILQDYHGSQMAFDISSDSVYIVYHADSNDSTGYRPINFLYSSDLGQTWSDEQTVGHTRIYANDLLIKKCAGTVFIVWSSIPIPEETTFEVITVVSHDGGESWSEKMILSEDGGRPAQLPCIACNKATDEVVVGWVDYSVPGDLYFRITENGGYNWEPEIHAINHHCVSKPNLEFVDDTLWGVWEDFSFASQREIGFSKSTDRGLTWNQIERLTRADGQSHCPWLSYDNGKLHLLWYEVDRPPHGSIEIYYKRWEPETNIKDVPKPESISLLTSYPNPFNSTTIISYSNLKGGEIKIYNVSGQLIRTFQVDLIKEGKIIWDATDAQGNKISSGIYFARARTSQNSNIIKLLYIK